MKITTFINWLKENWFKVGVIVLLIGGWYWYGLMPIQIKKECASYAAGIIEKRNNGEGYIPVDDRLGGDANNKDFQSYYERCLKERGL